MTLDRLADVEWMPIPGATGGTWAEDLPDRVTLHTTEGPTIASAVATYRRTLAVPTFTSDLTAQRTVQHLGLDTSATALMNRPSGVETNRLGRNIQIEIVGFALDSPRRTDSELAYLGGLLRRIRAAGVDFTFTSPEFLPYPASYGPSRVRFTFEQWDAFNGVCGHQHVPENDHGDPGALDVGRAFRLSEPASQHQPQPMEAAGMAQAFQYGTDLDTFAVEPDGSIVTRYYQGGQWRKILLGGGARVGAQLAVVRDYAGAAGRIDLFIEAAKGGLCHAWYTPAVPNAAWQFEVLP